MQCQKLGATQQGLSFNRLAICSKEFDSKVMLGNLATAASSCYWLGSAGRVQACRNAYKASLHGLLCARGSS
jgi:hypothetical protein